MRNSIKYDYTPPEVLYNRTRYNTEDLLSIMRQIPLQPLNHPVPQRFEIVNYEPSSRERHRFQKEFGLPLCVHLRGRVTCKLGLVRPSAQGWVGLDPLVQLSSSLSMQAPQVLVEQLVLSLIAGPYTNRSQLGKDLAWAAAYCHRHPFVLRFDETAPSPQEIEQRGTQADEGVRLVQRRHAALVLGLSLEVTR